MKFLLFKYSVPLVYALTALLLVLATAAVMLYAQRGTALQQNRQLILQNDSILSENIKLKNSLLQAEVKQLSKKASLSSVNHQ